ncbi:hypothetical protein HD806DRAFT_160210 [Xylariaceae sp. AK1471]|nr:hypothetical protein HD806DRAFT_160210 [Xylariaceae sp. AK1471]
MTSRFVSGGTITTGDGAVETKAQEPPPMAAVERKGSGSGSGSGSNTVQWEAVQKDLEEERRRRDEARRTAVEGGVAGGERSLYEVLQANKAAKQAAFEEANRIRNQFRALDDDEIDFLHGVRDEKRAEEERTRRETEERLAGFRKAQQLVGGGADIGEDGGGVVVNEDEEWVAAAGRKRKREKEKGSGLKGVKVKRRTSHDEDKTVGGDKVDEKLDAVSSANGNGDEKLIPISAVSGTGTSTGTAKVPTTATPLAEAAKSKPKLGLVDYGSDEDD